MLRNGPMVRPYCCQTGVHLGLIQNWDCAGGKPGGQTGLTWRRVEESLGGRGELVSIRYQRCPTVVFDGDWALQSPKVQNPRGTYVQIFLAITSLGFYTCLFLERNQQLLINLHQYYYTFCTNFFTIKVSWAMSASQ